MQEQPNRQTTASDNVVQSSSYCTNRLDIRHFAFIDIFIKKNSQILQHEENSILLSGQSQSHFTPDKEKKKNNNRQTWKHRTGTNKATNCNGLLHRSCQSGVTVGWAAVQEGRRNNPTAPAHKSEESTIFNTTTAYSTFGGKKKSFKIDWSLMLPFQTAQVVTQYGGLEGERTKTKRG